MHTLGNTQFVGGVTDGMYGAAAFDFHAEFTGKLSARKTWFFFDNEIVALGANITCPGTNSVITSINQCLLKGNIRTSSSDMSLAQGLHNFSNVWWVHHDNV